METKKTMKISSCNKSKLVVGRTGTKVSIIDTIYELYPKRYISKVSFEGKCQKKSMKTMSGSSSNKGKLLDDMDMSEVEPSVGFYPEHLNEVEISVPHPDVPNRDDGLPDSTRYEVDDTSNAPSPFQRSILDHLSSLDDPEIEPSYKRLMECLSKDENAFTYDVPSGDHVVPSSKNLNGHDLVCTTDEHGRVLYIEPSDIKNEHEELWRKATRQKIYASGKVSRSYLDYHPDLAVQIKSAGRDERLSLLRKFFFWFKNLCHDGAYKPWMPKTAYEYEPGQAFEVRRDEARG